MTDAFAPSAGEGGVVHRADGLVKLGYSDALGRQGVHQLRAAQLLVRRLQAKGGLVDVDQSMVGK